MFKACKAELVSTKQAACELGVSTATLRSWMKHQHINIGVYDKKDGSSRAACYIYRSMLDAEKRRLMGDKYGAGNFKDSVQRKKPG